MDIERFKKQKDTLLKMNVPFSMYTDENFMFSHDPINYTSVISFDDDTETFVCVKKSDSSLKTINIMEYDRVLFIQLMVSDDNNAVKKFIDKCDTGIISQKQKDELHNLLK